MKLDPSDNDLRDEGPMNPRGSRDAVRAFYDLTIVQTDIALLEGV
jgi:hypothetical protein